MLAFCQHWSVWIGSHKTSAWLYKTFIFWRGEETVTAVDFYKGRGGGEWIRYLRHLVSLNVYPIGWVVLFYLCFLSDESSNESFTFLVFSAVFNCFFAAGKICWITQPGEVTDAHALLNSWWFSSIGWNMKLKCFGCIVYTRDNNTHQPRSQDSLSSFLGERTKGTTSNTPNGAFGPQRSQSIKIGIDLSIDKSKKSVNLIWLISIVYRSGIGRNRWHPLRSSVYRHFYRFHRFISQDTSVHLFIKKWKLIHANNKFTLNFILKKSLKKSYLFFKTRFKIFLWWLILARFKSALVFTI